MLNRGWLKSSAKAQLKHYYWTAFAVCQVGGLLGGAGAGGGFRYRFNSSSGLVENRSVGRQVMDSANVPGALTGLFAVFIPILFAVLIGGILFTIFVSNPISVGICTWFITAPRGGTAFSLLFSSFGNGRYKPIVKTMFFANLYIWLWGLLFVIPGIIKSYQYRMVPYLISDHPYLTPDEAMYYSGKMTDGYKGELFVMDLSFIGWYLLGTLLLGIGTLFVVPYEEATWAQTYFFLRQRVQIPPPQWAQDPGGNRDWRLQ